MFLYIVNTILKHQENTNATTHIVFSTNSPVQIVVTIFICIKLDRKNLLILLLLIYKIFFYKSNKIH